MIKKSVKKGQGIFGMSFSMIFSIIIIIAIIGVAFYAITYFLNLSRCGQITTFYDDLQDEANQAWVSTNHRKVFEGSVPSGIEYVCFGLVSQSVLDSDDRTRRDRMKKRNLHFRK